LSYSTATASVIGALPQQVMPRLCSECLEPISPKRLTATKGKARQCVPCLEKLGDVLPIRRYDESLPSGEVVSQTFVQNDYIEHQMQRVNTLPAPDSAFEMAVGDDQFLNREHPNPNNEHAYNLTEAFEADTDVVIVPNTIHSIN
jgi:hypothetical protein